MKKNWLITGCASGLGQFLAEHFECAGLNRQNANDFIPAAHVYDVIVHCAFSKPQNTKPNADAEFLKQVLKIPHRKFVFISSVDVYRKDSVLHTEAESLVPLPELTEYARAKIECEYLVQAEEKDYLIIRPASLMGSVIFSRNISRLIQDSEPVLTLTADSTWNFVSYSELAQLVTEYTQSRIEGIVNLVRSKSVTVREVAGLLNKEVKFGSYNYITPEVSNAKASEIIPALQETSLEFIKRRFHYG